MPTPAGAPSPPENVHLTRSTPVGTTYWKEDRYALELERLYFRSWLNLGREEEFTAAGEYRTYSVGPEGILLARDSEGAIRGFYNLCRHRGARLTDESVGRFGASIVCPYHAWTYGLDGRLVGARHTDRVMGFDRAEFGLRPIRIERLGGFLWANLDPSAGSVVQSFGPLIERFGAEMFDRLRKGASRTYTVEANWKLVVENFSECYHCAPVHPSLNRLTPYQSGGNDAWFLADGGRSEWAGGWMEFAGDFTSMVRSGYTRRAPLPGRPDRDRRRVYYYVLFPNLFFSLHPDYLMLHRVWPQGPERSIVENDFYFDRSEVEGSDFDPSDAVELWDEINRQDWAVCELAQKGSRSRQWLGGRYSDTESMVCDFDRCVEDHLGRPPDG